MKPLILYLYLFTIISSAQKDISSNQEESLFKIKESPSKASLLYNIKLTDKLIFQNGLSIRKNFYYNTFEIPVMLKYEMSDNWSTVFGVQTRTFINSNFTEPFNNFEKPTNSYFSIGTEHTFKNDAVGNLNIGFPFDFQVGLKF